MSRFEGARRLLPARGERALPALAGLLLVLSFPPFPFVVLPFVALVPLLLFIADRPDGAAGRLQAARGGWLAGLVYFGGLLYWLVVALIAYSALAIPAYVLTVLVLAAFTSVFAMALHSVVRRTPTPFALATAVLWTAMEWLQGHLGDLSFPWLGLGTALSDAPLIAGAADLVGARGLTFWVALVNGLVATLILRFRADRPIGRVAFVTVVVVVLPAAYGLGRAATLDVRPAAQVAVVQPNIPEDLKMDRARALDSSLVAVQNLTRRIPPGSVDLVVWPEVTLPVVLPHPTGRLYRAETANLSRAVGAPIVAGAYGLEGVRDDDLTFFNSAFLVSSEGVVGTEYRKQFLVPFVERIPFVDPAWLEAITGDLRWFGGLGRGTGAEVLAAADAEFGILICYESIFGSLSRRFRRNGADYLVNITNDAWYGREPWYARTSALWQHPAHLTMRAIENRVGIARSANTGISMFVDPLGRTYERTELFEPDVHIATVYTTDVLTLYARWGDWLATSAFFGALLLVGWAVCQGRRDASRTRA